MPARKRSGAKEAFIGSMRRMRCVTALASVTSPALEEAKSLLESIKAMRAQAISSKAKTDHDSAISMSRELLAEGDLDRAETFTDKALTAIPNSPQALVLRNQIAMQKRKRFGGAR